MHSEHTCTALQIHGITFAKLCDMNVQLCKCRQHCRPPILESRLQWDEQVCQIHVQVAKMFQKYSDKRLFQKTLNTLALHTFILSAYHHITGREYLHQPAKKEFFHVIMDESTGHVRCGPVECIKPTTIGSIYMVVLCWNLNLHLFVWICQWAAGGALVSVKACQSARLLKS